MSLTFEQKLDIILLHKNGKSYRSIAHHMGVDERSVSKWVNRYKNEGHLNICTKNRGRKRKLSDTSAKKARTLLLSGEFAGAKKVAMEMFKQDNIKVSGSTIIRSAKRVSEQIGAPIRCSRAKPVKQLNAATIEKRLGFATANKSTNWSATMFVDRKKFLFFYPKTCVHHLGWVEVGKGARTAPKVNNPMVVNLYAGITRYGPTKVHVVAGTSKHKSKYTTTAGNTSRNITLKEMQDVLLLTLLPEGRRIFSTQGISSFKLLLDNDPCHKNGAARALEKWHQLHPGCVVSVVPNYPPHSPDLNPIENVWSWVQRKVQEKACGTFEEFKHEVIKTFKELPKQMIDNLYGSMVKRMAAVVQNGGGKTKY